MATALFLLVGSPVSSNTNCDLLTLMQRSAIESYPNEACGLILSIGKKSVPISCPNVSEQPRDQFMIATSDYANALSKGEVVGVWHTHVNLPSNPSPADLVGCEASSVPWFILSIYKNEIEQFSFSELNKVEPSGFEMDYVGRPYVFGVLDCWSLVRDYYRRELSIQLDDFPRIHKFWANGHDFFGENWEKQGFIRAEGTPRVGDLFLMQTDGEGKINHIGIYIGNEVMLHHCHGRLSTRDIYGGYWLKHTTHHIRHKTLC